MLLCAAWGLVTETLGAGRGIIDQAAWMPMIFSAAVTLLAGLILLRLSEGEPHPAQRTKSALLSVALIWGAARLANVEGKLPSDDPHLLRVWLHPTHHGQCSHRNGLTVGPGG